MNEPTKDDILIAEFMDYIFIGRNLVLHSSRNPSYLSPIRGFIKREHLNVDISFYEETINNSPGNKELTNEIIKSGIDKGYYFTAIRNRATKLDYLSYNLKYGSSWDSLMPVVEKIYFMKIPSLNEEQHALRISLINNIKDSLTRLLSLDIKNVYRVVIKFIKWYNENK